jgi:hypothetical protein
MGSAYLPPRDTEGWTFAGCVPAGLFGFVNGSTLWGVLGLLGCLGVPIVSWVYAIYVGIKGKELAWQNRRFDSVYQFRDTMRAWNSWGIFWMVIGIIGFILYFVLVFSLGMMGAMEEGAFSTP